MAERKLHTAFANAGEFLLSIPNRFTIQVSGAERSADMLKGVGLFEDAEYQKVYRSVQRRLSVNTFDIARQLQKADPSQEVSLPAIEGILSDLIDYGFVTKHDPDPGGLPLYSPSAKGIRIFRALERI